MRSCFFLLIYCIPYIVIHPPVKRTILICLIGTDLPLSIMTRFPLQWQPFVIYLLPWYRTVSPGCKSYLCFLTDTLPLEIWCPLNILPLLGLFLGTFLFVRLQPSWSPFLMVWSLTSRYFAS
jgi:hypothetical protein